jgi:SAM-dependent methyltransferase
MRTLARLPLTAAGGRARVLDVGCGNGLFFPVLEQIGDVTGIETDLALLDADAPERARIRSEPLGPAYAGLQFELITALDVLEHMRDDRAAFAHMVELLAPGGYLVLTVPAHMSLWDRHDELNHHYRRYSRASLQALIGDALETRELRYLFQATFAPKYLLARLNRRRARVIEQQTLPPRWLNRALTQAFDLEERLLRRVRPGFGTSLLAVLHKARNAGA